MNERIMITKAYLPPMEEYTEYLKKVWDSHMLTNMGELHEEFEAQLTEFLNVPSCLAFSNGHMALELAIQAMKLKGEVITTPYTFASTTHAIVRNGLTPVFCDIKQSNYTMDEDRIESLITEKTCAIVPVHVYGQICNVEKIQRIAEKYHLKVIYDAAHAFGVKYKGKGIGNYGDATMFSLHATKPFHSIEGGIVTFSDYNYGIQINQLRNFGFMGEDLVCEVGANAKMSEFHAAMGLCNLKYYTEITDGRKRVVEQYRQRLCGVKGLYILDTQKDVDENYSYFPVLFDKTQFGKGREEVHQMLEKKGICSRRYFYPLTKDFLCYKTLFAFQRTPVAEYVADNILTLPLYDSLSEQDVNMICDIIIRGD